MVQPDFDAIIAGAGAGGATAACYLTQAGLRVLVVEKARLPRHKPCGGAIPRPTLDRFPVSLQKAVRATPSEVRFTYPGLPPVDFPLPGCPVTMVMRSEFDALLLASSGAEVLEGSAVTDVEEADDEVRVHLDRRRISARFLIGADGASSRVAHRLGLRKKRQMGGTLEAEVPLGRSALPEEWVMSRAVFALGAVPYGYVWAFPKGDCLSVGIGRFRPGRVNLHLALQREMGRMGISLDGVRILGHPIPCYHAPPWPWWTGRPQERLSTRRCLLVGDAAGLVDPLLGEGIRYAIASARLASAAILRGDLSGYEEEIWREIGHSLATVSLAADLFYRQTRKCFQLGVRNRATFRLFVDILTEKTSYQGIARRLCASTAFWLLDRRRRRR